MVYRKSASEIKNEIFSGYMKGVPVELHSKNIVPINYIYLIVKFSIQPPPPNSPKKYSNKKYLLLRPSKFADEHKIGKKPISKKTFFT